MRRPRLTGPVGQNNTCSKRPSNSIAPVPPGLDDPTATWLLRCHLIHTTELSKNKRGRNPDRPLPLAQPTASAICRALNHIRWPKTVKSLFSQFLAGFKTPTDLRLVNYFLTAAISQVLDYIHRPRPVNRTNPLFSKSRLAAVHGQTGHEPILKANTIITPVQRVARAAGEKGNGKGWPTIL
jgi:hypothetical protein